MTRQRLADQADRARVDHVGSAAVGRAGDRMAQPAGVAERAHQRPAFGVDVGAMRVRRRAARPRRRARRPAGDARSSKNGHSR